MKDAQIATLLRKRYTPAHIANYGQCSIAQVTRVQGLTAFAYDADSASYIYAGNDVHAADAAAKGHTSETSSIVWIDEDGKELSKWRGGYCYLPDATLQHKGR